jgi:hypothetical protein
MDEKELPEGLQVAQLTKRAHEVSDPWMGREHTEGVQGRPGIVGAVVPPEAHRTG